MGKRFKVSMSAAVLRAADLELVPWPIALEFLGNAKRLRRTGGGRGRADDHEGRKVVNAFGKAYTELVVDALQARRIALDAVPSYLRKLPSSGLAEVISALGRPPLG